MSFFPSSTFAKPKRPKPRLERKPLKKIAKKGEFWLFVSKILSKFFLRIDLPRRCELCDGSRYGGPIQPAHSRRRADIRVGDWWYALRCAVLCNDDHFEIDRKGRREAEPLIETIITDRFKKMGLSEDDVKALLLQCATEVQAEHPGKGDEPGPYDQYFVTFD